MARDTLAFESAWWGKCLITFGEENKQITYAHRMGLEIVPDGGRWPAYQMAGCSVLDIGGGPVSMLLKCYGVTRPTVVDPCPYPDWVAQRYKAAGIKYVVGSGETFILPRRFDEVWIYNVLEHVVDPEQVIANAWAHTYKIRLFEWIDGEPQEGHPHQLKAAELNKWLMNEGLVEEINENSAVGTAYYGVFTR